MDANSIITQVSREDEQLNAFTNEKGKFFPFEAGKMMEIFLADDHKKNDNKSWEKINGRIEPIIVV